MAEGKYEYATEPGMSDKLATGGPLFVGLDGLSESSARLAKVVADLEQRLEPLRNRSPETAPSVMKEVSPGSPLTQRIAQVTGDLNETRERLTLLLHEIEV